MSHTIYAAKFEQTITHQHILLQRGSQSHVFLGRKVSRINGAPVTVILCWHVLIVRRILLILAIFYGDYIQWK